MPVVLELLRPTGMCKGVPVQEGYSPLTRDTRRLERREPFKVDNDIALSTRIEARPGVQESFVSNGAGRKCIRVRDQKRLSPGLLDGDHCGLQVAREHLEPIRRRHIKAPAGTPLANAMLGVLHALGQTDIDRFGDSEGVLDLNTFDPVVAPLRGEGL